MQKRLSLTFVYLSIGAFFTALGIAGILPEVNEGMFNLGAEYAVEAIFGVIEILAGLYFIAGRFMRTTRKTTFAASFVILCFWLIRVVVSRFVFGFDAIQHNFFGWLLALTAELVIASGVGLLLKAND